MFFEANGLYKSWPGRTIDVSFGLEKGCIAALVGPSGSGKSTVLRIIAGLESPDARLDKETQNIMLSDKDITHIAPGKRNCGMVFQSPSLFLHMNVADNVAYGLVCRGMPKNAARRQAVSMLETMNLASFADRKIETLSGGEAQRVALCRTLITKPQLVLLDEPLSSLDAPLRKKLAHTIRDTLTKQEQTALFVTHDIEEAKTVADKILLLKEGRIVWNGNSSDFNEALFDA